MLAKQESAGGSWKRASDLVRDFRSGRRVSDRVMQAFDYACAMSDVETATMLLTVLENIVEREVQRIGGDRRRSDSGLGAATARLRDLRDVTAGSGADAVQPGPSLHVVTISD